MLHDCGSSKASVLNQSHSSMGSLTSPPGSQTPKRMSCSLGQEAAGSTRSSWHPSLHAAQQLPCSALLFTHSCKHRAISWPSQHTTAPDSSHPNPRHRHCSAQANWGYCSAMGWAKLWSSLLPAYLCTTVKVSEILTRPLQRGEQLEPNQDSQWQVAQVTWFVSK